MNNERLSKTAKIREEKKAVTSSLSTEDRLRVIANLIVDQILQSKKSQITPINDQSDK